MATDKRLGKLLDTYDKKVQDAQQKKATVKKAEETFLQKFDKHKTEVIRPALTELGEELKARGHRYEIREEPYRQERDGKTQEASISLEFFLSRGDDAFDSAARYGTGSNPHLSFHTQHYSGKVFIHESTMGGWGGGGYAGGIGEVTLAELTPDLIREKFVALFGKIIK